MKILNANYAQFFPLTFRFSVLPDMNMSVCKPLLSPSRQPLPLTQLQLQQQQQPNVTAAGAAGSNATSPRPSNKDALLVVCLLCRMALGRRELLHKPPSVRCPEHCNSVPGTCYWGQNTGIVIFFYLSPIMKKTLHFTLTWAYHSRVKHQNSQCHSHSFLIELQVMYWQSRKVSRLRSRHFLFLTSWCEKGSTIPAPNLPQYI